MRKPACIYVDAAVDGLIKNSDNLSQEFTVFRNGGIVNNIEAKPFVELTPELLQILQAIFGE